jgi:hypothetical protein
MKVFTKDRTMTALRLVLGAVILQLSCSFVFATRSAEAFRHAGFPNALRLALGWCEIAAAILFLIPKTMVAGGLALIGVFLFAIGLHVLHGEFDVGALLVWTVAVIAILAHRADRLQAASH